MISEGLTNAIIKIFEIYGESITEAAKQTLSNNKLNATGNLSDSFNYKISSDNGIITLSISAEDYLKYVEAGRNPGSMPPIQSIIKWIQAKGIDVPSRKSGTRFGGIEAEGVVSRAGIKRGKAAIIRRNVKVSNERFAFAIAKSIMLKGTKAKKVFQPIIEYVAPEISKALSATVINFIKQGIQDVWKEEGNENTDYLKYTMNF